VVFPRVYERSADVFRDDAILVIEGKVDTRGERPQLVVDRAESWTPPASGTAPPRAQPPRGDPPGVARAAGTNGLHVPADVMVRSAVTNGRHVLKVVVPRNGDDNACVRLLEQLHVLVERFPGQDEIQLVLHDRTGCQIVLSGADIPVKHTTELESQVRTLVGEANLQIVS
jgi:hypothetical protein